MLSARNEASAQRVSLDIPTQNKEVFVVLNRKALVTLLVDMPQTAGVIVSMISNCVGSAHPAHESTHFAVHQRTQDQVIVIWHELVAEKLDLVKLKPFVQDPLKG